MGGISPALQFSFALLLALMSGCAALSHELLWTRRMVDLIGATPQATARVFGCFFLGLAAGSMLSSAYADKIRRWWLFLAVSQFGIALFAVPILTIPAWSGFLWQSLGLKGLLSAGGPVKLLLSVLIMMPPSVLMGLTLPVMVRGVLRNGRSLKKQGTWLYAVNTAGGVLGLVLTSLITIPWLGIAGSLLVAVGLNIFLGVCCFILHFIDSQPEQTGPEEKKASRAKTGEKEPRSHCGIFVVAFVSGACVLAMEMLCLHLVNQVALVATFPETAVLVTVILLLSVSSGLIPIFAAFFKGRSVTMLSILLSVSGIAAFFVPFLFHALTGKLVPVASGNNYISYMFQVIGLALASFGPCVFLAGMVFPAAFNYFEEQFGGESGKLWGSLLAINGLGGLFGAEAANYVLMPFFGMNTGFGVIALVYILTAFLFHTVRKDQKHNLWVVFYFLVFICLVGAFEPLENLPLVNREHWGADGDNLIDISCGPEGVIAVIKQKMDENMGKIMLMNNVYILGGDVVLSYQERQALLPMMLHPRPRKAATIGVATGVTAGVFLHDPGLERLDAVEISGLVLENAEDHFSEGNNGLFLDPRVRVVKEDARIFIAAAHEEYDVILGDLFMPWESGAGRLYSLEHFQATYGALRQGGMFCQWLPMHMLTVEQLEIIMTTFLKVYGKTYLFKVSEKSGRPWVALIGFKDGELNRNTPALRLEMLSRNMGQKAEILIDEEEVRRLYLGSIEAGPAQKRKEVNTLDNNRVEINAARTYVTKGHRYLEEIDGQVIPEALQGIGFRKIEDGR